MENMIIYSISKKYNRFGSMQKPIPLISKQMLINQLCELEEDGIIERKVYAEIPPRVEYTITSWQFILPIIYTIQDFGLKDMKRSPNKNR